jgi:hypothetical protein
MAGSGGRIMVSLREFFSIDYPVRRATWLALLILVSVILYRPIGLPLPITKEVRDAYNTVENLPAGSVVVFDVSISSGQYLDQTPGTEAFVKHLVDLVKDRGVKIVFVSSLSPDAPLLLEKYIIGLESVLDEIEYGEDWVQLGFIGGQETGIAAFGADIWSSMPTDAFGTPIESIPMMADIKTGADLDIIINNSGGTFDPWLRQINEVYGTKQVMVIVTISIPGLTPYYLSGQVQGFLGGQRGGAEYELLIGKPGKGATQMDGVSIVHLIMIAVILGGNIVNLVQKGRGQEEN